MTPTTHFVLASFALALLTFCVGLRLLYVRTVEMREKRVHPQAASTSIKMAAKLQNVQAADNFRNLFETPVLFYALTTMAIATNQSSAVLIYGVWAYVALRMVHSYIHCTYNKVVHRFAAFGVGFILLVFMWASFALSTVAKSAA